MKQEGSQPLQTAELSELRVQPAGRRIKNRERERKQFLFKMKRTGIKNQLHHAEQFEDSTREITFHNFLSTINGIIYIQNLEFIDDFKEAIKYEYPCTTVRGS